MKKSMGDVGGVETSYFSRLVSIARRLLERFITVIQRSFLWPTRLDALLQPFLGSSQISPASIRRSSNAILKGQHMAVKRKKQFGMNSNPIGIPLRFKVRDSGLGQGAFENLRQSWNYQREGLAKLS